MDVRIALKRPHPAQAGLIRTAMNTRHTIAACGRRFGKTEAAKQVAIRRALRGERVWWLTPTASASTDAWQDILNTLRGIPMTDVSLSDRRITLPNGGMIAVRSAHSYHNLRGAGLDYAVLDEAAFMDSEVWASIIQPMLLERKGGALFLSTPFGRNWFFALYGMGVSDDEGEYKSLHYTSYDNPRIDADEIEARKRTAPERIFREEYMAEFLSDGGSVFRNVAERCVGSPQEPIGGRRYVFGVDWGREHDFTVIAVFDVEDKRMVAMERFNKVAWELQRGRLRALYDRYKPLHIIAEENSIGSVNIEALQREGLPVRPFQTTNRSKSQIIEGLALAMETEAVTLLNNDILRSELSAYQEERLLSGTYRYNAPSGMHDDTVIATALAWQAANRKSVGRIVFA